MTATEFKQAYSELPEKEQILVASLIAADRMAKDSEFAFNLARRHHEMDAGKKWSHSDLLELHDRLAEEGL